jgi:hypothetical protein
MFSFSAIFAVNIIIILRKQKLITALFAAKIIIILRSTFFSLAGNAQFIKM